MNCRRRKVAAACIIDCIGVGNSFAIMPIKRAVEEAIAAGERFFLLNLAGVPQLDRTFVQGLNSAKLAADRAGGALAVYGLTGNTSPHFAKYADTLRSYATEHDALKNLLPEASLREDQFHVLVLGSDKFQDTAFAGVNHYLNQGLFHYFSNPMADLATVCAVKPLVVFINAALGASDIRHVKRRIEEANGGPVPTFFFIFGIPPHEGMLRTFTAREGFDDALLIPFRGTELTLTNMDIRAFRQVLGKKIEGVLDGFYMDVREKKARFGQGR